MLHPKGVQGTKELRPDQSFHIDSMKPSTSLTGRIESKTLSEFICFGSGS